MSGPMPLAEVRGWAKGVKLRAMHNGYVIARLCETVEHHAAERSRLREKVAAMRVAGVANSPGPLYSGGFAAAPEAVLALLAEPGGAQP